MWSESGWYLQNNDLCAICAVMLRLVGRRVMVQGKRAADEKNDFTGTHEWEGSGSLAAAEKVSDIYEIRM
jgi:hypothetical protein